MPTKTNPTRIYLKGTNVFEEALAGAAIKPGMLLQQNADGEVIPHGVAAGAAENAYAVEDALQGRGIGTDYAEGERVSFVIAKPGDEIYAILNSGETVTKDEMLTSNGDGTLKVAGSTNIRVAQALEALDLSQTGDVDTRIRVRVL